MLSLILTVFCSTSIALLLKYNDTRNGHPLVLLAGNYLAAAISGVILLFIADTVSYSWQTLGFGSFLALLFVLSFFAFAKAVSAAGTALATVSSRLSVIIPIVLSIFFFNETPSEWQILGFVFTLFTIIAFYFSLKNNTQSTLPLSGYIYLLIVLFGIGINDFSMKVFNHWRPESEKTFFLLVIFSFSFFYSGAYIIIKRIPSEKPTFLRGVVLGIPNIFSSFFLLGALSALPAIIVYPLTNIGIILLTAIAAAIFWKEQLNRFGKLALLLGTIAIIFLSL